MPSVGSVMSPNRGVTPSPSKQHRTGSLFDVAPQTPSSRVGSPSGKPPTPAGYLNDEGNDAAGGGSQRRAHTPQVNRRSVVTNFGQRFAAVQHATGSLLHYENGRTVGHNLKRLPSPKPTHDFATSILLGGNHPQNKFRHMNKSFRRAVDTMASRERERPSIIGGSGGGGGAFGDDPSLSSSQAALSYQQRCTDEDGFERDMMRMKVRQRRASALGMYNIQQESSFLIGRSDAPLLGQPQQRAQTPGAGTAVGFEERTLQLPRTNSSLSNTRTSGRPSPMNATSSEMLQASVRSGFSQAATASTGSRPGTQQAGSRPSTQQANSRPNTQQQSRPNTQQAGSRPNTQMSQRAQSQQGGSHAASSVGGSRSGGKRPTTVVPAGSDIVPAFLRPKQKTWEETQEFSLNINGDYDSPFANKIEKQNLDNTDFVRGELVRFDARESAKQQFDANEQFIQTLSTLPQNSFAPPKIILMMFKFSNVRNLHSTKAMRRIGYPELHEQFSTAAKNGIITKVQYSKVLSKYLSVSEMLDSHRIIQCFDRNALGDVDLNMFLIGLQILLDCATPGDTMRYCFTLMDTNNKIPRYITRYEVQTLVGYANQSSEEMRKNAAAAGGEISSDDIRSDGEFDKMNRAIEELLEEAHRYDYMGRMPLKEFLESLASKVAATDKASEDKKNSTRKGAKFQRPKKEGDGQFMFGSAWQGTPVVAAVHRMSSKKMLYASLAPQHNPSDPHARPQE